MFRRSLLVLGTLLMAACPGDSGSDKPDQALVDLREADGPNMNFRDSGQVTPLQDGALDGIAPDLTAPDQALTDTLSASCKNGAKDPGESDVDCGGGGCPLCADDRACIGGENCASGVCTNNVCQVPTCQDQVQNGGETGSDCGGTSDCGPCPDGGGCLGSADCESLVCTNKICQTATCNDGVKNVDEAAKDCGGHCGPTCALDIACGDQSDCDSRFCSNDVCAIGATCQALRDGGVRADGIYTIDPNGRPSSDAVPAFCDMTTDGLGWTALAANGEIAAAETTAAGDCYPLISNDASAGCGDSSSLMNDFTLPGAQQAALSWRRLLAVAYGDTGYDAKLAYFAIDFGSVAPTAEERLGGSSYAPGALVTAHGLLRCNNEATMRIVHYTKAGTHNDVATGIANGKGTIFGHNTATSMSETTRRTFGFTDANGASTGIDDYQDGWSCSDIWIPQAVRGQRMVVLIN